MKKTVFGVYESASETMKAIDSLKARGYSGKNITIITDKEERLLDLDKDEPFHGDIKEVAEIEQERTLIDKLVHFFYDREPDLREKMNKLGLSERETVAYMEDVQSGKILVLLDLNSDKQPFEARLENGSPAFQAMDRYNSGLGMAEQPVGDPYTGEAHTRGEIGQDWSEREGAKSNRD